MNTFKNRMTWHFHCTLILLNYCIYITTWLESTCINVQNKASWKKIYFIDIESICLFYLGSIHQTLYHGYQFSITSHIWRSLDGRPSCCCEGRSSLVINFFISTDTILFFFFTSKSVYKTLLKKLNTFKTKQIHAY